MAAQETARTTLNDSAPPSSLISPSVAVASIHIQRLRGIYDGQLEDFTPLTVLVGPNGSGKSTILEALHIAAADPDPWTSVWRQRPLIQDPVRWLHWRGTPNLAPAISLTTGAGKALSWQILSQGSNGGIIRSAVGEGASGKADGVGRVYFLTLPTPNNQSTVAQLYSDAIISGGSFRIVEMMQRVLGSQDLRILVENDKPTLFLTFSDHAIPVAAGGSGVEWLVQLGLGLAVRPGSLVLIEEPELHLHPGAMREAARAVWVAVRSGVQVVLTTHSLEFIDSLLAETDSDAEFEFLSVYRLLLKNGELKSSRIAGPRVAFMRGTIEDDLR